MRGIRFGRFSSHQELELLFPSLIASEANSLIKKSRQPPALPCRLQHSTIGRKGLDRRVRDGYGYFPFTHRHRNCFIFSIPSPPPVEQKCNPYSFLRKEVIQPHLPIQLPCYDFTPVISPAFGSSPLAVRPLTSGITNSHGVTGGVYKTRERIHRSILICDY